jgi:hypothetical protein
VGRKKNISKMQILGVQTNSTYAVPSAQQGSNSSSSFASYFSEATGSSDNAVQEFLDYAKETPVQRMFDSWLASQHISKDQYNAMTPEEKQKLVDEFKEQLKQRLKSELSSSTSTAGTSTASA